MKIYMVFVFVTAAILLGASHLKDDIKVRPIDSTQDVIDCGREGGVAGMIARINEDGAVVSEWTAVCLTGEIRND